jgi:hypothetical protein
VIDSSSSSWCGLRAMEVRLGVTLRCLLLCGVVLSV